jgi:hypothetical protein
MPSTGFTARSEARQRERTRIEAEYAAFREMKRLCAAQCGVNVDEPHVAPYYVYDRAKRVRPVVGEGREGERNSMLPSDIFDPSAYWLTTRAPIEYTPRVASYG